MRDWRDACLRCDDVELLVVTELCALAMAVLRREGIDDDASQRMESSRVLQDANWEGLRSIPGSFRELCASLRGIAVTPALDTAFLTTKIESRLQQGRWIDPLMLGRPKQRTCAAIF